MFIKNKKVCDFMQNIFRAYDIRGLLDNEINEENVEKIGKAFGTFLNGEGTVVVSRDTRRDGKKLKKSLIDGLLSTGVDVLDIGMQSTPVLNFYCNYTNSKAGAQITASHNPPEYSGVRFRKGNGIGFPESIPKVKEIFFSENFLEGSGKFKEVEPKEPQEKYMQYILNKIKIENPITVVIDPGNGATSGFAKELFLNAGCNVVAIHNQPDSEFSGRGPNPSENKLIDLQQEVVINQAEIGIAFDGDGDRVVIVDDKGDVLNADETGYLIAEELLKENPGTIAMNVECSKILEKMVRKLNGSIKYIRVGDAFLAKAVEENNAIFAMEASNHFLIPKYFPADDGLLTGLFFASMISKKNKDLSELRKKIPVNPKQKRKVECDDDLKFKVIENLKEKLKKEHKIIEIDGIRINFKNSWVLIRASNTSPYIRITGEAENKKNLQAQMNKFEMFVNEQKERLKK